MPSKKVADMSGKGHKGCFGNFYFGIGRDGNLIPGNGRSTDWVCFFFFYGLEGQILSDKINQWELDHYGNNIQKNQLWVFTKILV